MKNSSGPRPPNHARILIVEDQAAIREMLAEVLSGLPEFEVVAEAENLDEALRLAGSTRPDVIILDWLFPGGGGLSFLQAMRPSRLRSHVLVLSGNTTQESVREALMNGARGFFEKGGNLEEFIRALRTVAAGGAYFGPVASDIVQQLVRGTKPVPLVQKPKPSHQEAPLPPSPEVPVEAELKAIAIEPAVVPAG